MNEGTEIARRVLPKSAWAGARSMTLAQRLEDAGYTFWRVKPSAEPWVVRDGNGKDVKAFTTLEAVREWIRGGGK